MFDHTYQTTVCKAYLTREIITELERAKINHELTNVSLGQESTWYNLFEVTPYSKEVPAFHHPIEITTSRGEKTTVIDQRPNMGIDKEGNLRVTNQTQYNFMALRGVFESIWNDDYRENFLSVGTLPLKVYGRMMTDNIRRRLGLDITDQQTLMALSVYFYICQFKDALEFSEEEKTAIAVRIRNTVLVPVEVTLEILNQIGVLKDLEDFCQAIRTVIPNPRVEKITPAFIITINMGQWYGGNAKEVMAVALEFPPTFLAIVYTALTDRSMYSASLSKLVDSLSKNNSGLEFRQSIKALMRDADQ